MDFPRSSVLELLKTSLPYRIEPPYLPLPAISREHTCHSCQDSPDFKSPVLLSHKYSHCGGLHWVNLVNLQFHFPVWTQVRAGQRGSCPGLEDGREAAAITLWGHHSQMEWQMKRYPVGPILSSLFSLCLQLFSMAIYPVGQWRLMLITRHVAADTRSWDPYRGTSSSQPSLPVLVSWFSFDVGRGWLL